jgi:hypothetical protein
MATDRRLSKVLKGTDSAHCRAAFSCQGKHGKMSRHFKDSESFSLSPYSKKSHVRHALVPCHPYLQRIRIGESATTLRTWALGRRGYTSPRARTQPGDD